MKTLGLDLGGTKIAAAIVEDGKILTSRRVDTPQTGFAAVADALVGVAEDLLASASGDVAGIGIGSPGPLDYVNGKVLFAPNIPGMDDAPIVATLQERLGRKVTLENDANAAGYAEHLYGAAKPFESSIYVTISTGIGGGLFLGDRVIRGAHGTAGEIGHMTLLPGGPMGGDGHLGSLEGIAAGRSIERDASYVYGRPMTAETLFELAKAGDRKALGIIDNAARFTGVGLANLLKMFDPEVFVLGGGLTNVGDFYLDRIRRYAAEHLIGYPDAPILMAALGTDAGVIGAAAVAGHDPS